MFELGLLILYANDPGARAHIHRDFPRNEPAEEPPILAVMSRLSKWLRLGLLSRHPVELSAQADGNTIGNGKRTAPQAVTCARCQRSIV